MSKDLVGVRFPILGLQSYWFDEALDDDDRFGGGFGLGPRGAAAGDQGLGVLLKLAKGFFCRKRVSWNVEVLRIVNEGFVIFVVGEAKEFGDLRLLGFGGRMGSGREGGDLLSRYPSHSSSSSLSLKSPSHSSSSSSLRCFATTPPLRLSVTTTPLLCRRHVSFNASESHGCLPPRNPNPTTNRHPTRRDLTPPADAAEVRATGNNVIPPGGLAAMAQSAAGFHEASLYEFDSSDLMHLSLLEGSLEKEDVGEFGEIILKADCVALGSSMKMRHWFRICRRYSGNDTLKHSLLLSRDSSSGMDSAAGQILYPLHRCKTVHLVRHAQGVHNVAGEKNHDEYMSYDYFDAHLTPLGWNQVENLQKHVKATGLSKTVELVVVSPLLRTMQTAVGVFGGEVYTDGISEQPLMMENVGHSDHLAVSSLNCPPFIAVELCREQIGLHPCDKRRTISEYRNMFPAIDFSLIESEEDILWKPDVREKVEAVSARGLKFLEW
ncbi:Phosphoglycerate mutase-like protein [Vigna angularis]|uniref:Phosphoglycerate mutase-like protein n=2 Tax=Phaseoleae TaxID=163735 RepID=A0A8T0K3H6_PHAAN|nr:Phosphoglycerate mutase-like protein [Vigna angularis]